MMCGTGGTGTTDLAPGAGSLATWPAVWSEMGAALSWRDCPKQSLSDWTIAVRTASSGPKIYHVHKVYLGAGERPSGYFKHLFRGMSEGASLTSELEFEQASAAAAFPAFLDFTYTGKLRASTEIATALLHVRIMHARAHARTRARTHTRTHARTHVSQLAVHLRCRTLHDAVAAFIKEDLRPVTAPVYFTEGTPYSLEKIAHAAQEECLRLTCCVSWARDKLYRLRPPLFANVMLSPERKCENGYPHSMLLTEYALRFIHQTNSSSTANSIRWLCALRHRYCDLAGTATGRTPN